MRKISLALVFLLASLARAQSKPVAPPRLSDKAEALRAAQPARKARQEAGGGDRTESFQLSDKAVAEIRTLQLRQAQLTIQAQQLLAQYQTQREQLDAEIRAAEERALKEAGADPAKYKVDDASLAIVPNPVPSSAGPSEQKK